MKAFSNRYELKYLIDWPTYYKIKKCIEPLFKKDPAGGIKGKYGVVSTYYDTPNLKFFWDKIDGEDQRIKIRLRKYINYSKDKINKNNVFLEIKERKNKNIFKKRAVLKEQTVNLLLKNHSFEESFINESNNKSIENIKEAIYLQSILGLKPMMTISYIREPFVSKDNLPVRISFDSNVRYRSKDLSLTFNSTDKHLLHPNHIIMEIKYTDYFPQWLTQIIQKNMCEVRTFSKYCSGMENFLNELKVLNN